MPDKIRTGIIYCATFYPPVDHPLEGTSYFGQSSGWIDDTEKILQRRLNQHSSSARCHPKEVGFLALVSDYGIGRFEVHVMYNRSGQRDEVHDWLNEMEKAVIASNGGTLRDMEQPLFQTLNLTSGGCGLTASMAHEALSTLRFNRFVSRLRQFSEQFGHVVVPRAYVSPDGVKLGHQVHNERSKKLFATGQPERKKALDDLGFVWVVEDLLWKSFIDELRLFHSDKGNCLVPKRFVAASGFPLGMRVGQVRGSGAAYVANHPDRISMLNSMRFFWNKYDANYAEFLLELKAFAQKYRHCRIPKRFVTPSGYKLGVIASGVRCSQNMVKGRPLRLAELHAIGLNA